MESAALNASEFFVAWCPACGKDVVTHTDYDAQETPLRRCVLCDESALRKLRVASVDELKKLGFAEIVEGCGSGGCGTGGCGRS